jgi:hypothetical protein
MKITHTMHGDRLLITAEVPSESVTETGAGKVGVTLDAEDWIELYRRTTRERQAAERRVDSDLLRSRVVRVLAQAASNALYLGQDPVAARRRAVAAVLHHAADMVQAGTIEDLEILWPLEGTSGPLPAMSVHAAVRGGKQLDQRISLDFVTAGAVKEGVG